MVVLVVIQTVLVAVLGLLVVALLRSHAEILRRLHDAGLGLDEAHEHPVGPAPVAAPTVRTRDGVPEPGPGAGPGGARDVVGTSSRGSTVSVSAHGTPTLLAFLTTGCTTCQAFWREFASGVDLPGGVRLAIVAKGDEAEDGRAVAALAPRDVVTVQSSEAWADYAVPASPYFVLVGAGRVLGEGAALTWDQVRGLLERAVGATIGDRDHRRRRTTRLQDTDDELLAAGLLPGDPSLYPTSTSTSTSGLGSTADRTERAR
jgi:hypothetical protein